jgi:hypothetical protein
LLEAMCDQPPALSVLARETTKLTLSDWSENFPQLESRYRPVPDRTDRPALLPSVQLLRTREDDLIIAFDGELQFEVTAADAPELHAVLPLCDGKASIDEIAETTGLPAEVVARQLRDAIEAGVCLGESSTVDAMVVRS